MRRILKAAAALALAGAVPGVATAADCKARMEAIATDYAEFFSGRDAVFLNNQPVLRDLRNAAVRLQAQGLDEACGNVVSAIETAIEAYRAEGEEASSPTAPAPEAAQVPAPTTLEAKAPTGTQPAADASPARVTGEPRAAAPSADAMGDAAARAALEARAVPLLDSVRDTAEIAGTGVYSLDGERLGDARGLLLRDGAATHLVVEHGGFWTLGQRRVAVPAGIVRWDPEGKTFLVPLGGDQMAEAPGYDAGDEAWTAEDNDGFYAGSGG